MILSFLASPGKGQGFKNLYGMSCTQNCSDVKGNWTSRLAYSSASEKLPDQGVYKYMYTLLENKAILPSGRAAFMSVPHWGVLYTRMVEVPGQSVKEESAADGKWMPIPYFVK